MDDWTEVDEGFWRLDQDGRLVCHLNVTHSGRWIAWLYPPGGRDPVMRALSTRRLSVAMQEAKQAYVEVSRPRQL
jgi:hypothetical protein